MAGPIKIAILADARQAQAAFLKVSASADSMGAKVTRTGSRLTKSLTLPIVAIAAASVKMSTDFNTAMTKIQTQAGASAHDVEVLSKQVLGLAATSQQGPQELAESLFHLKSIGLDNVKAMKALKESSDLAALGGANLEDTTNALGGAWRSGIKGARDFHAAVGTLNAIVGAGNQTMQDLTDAIGTGFLPSARSFGLSLTSVGSALALMTDEGIPAQVAATRLRMTFSLLGAPTAKAAKLLATVGLNSDDLAKKMRQGGPNGGLVGAVGLLKDHLKDLNKVQQATLISGAFGGGRSSSAILTLLNNYDVLVKKQKQIEKTSGDVGKAIAKQAQTPQAQFKLLVSTIEVLAIQIGDVLLPDVIKIADALNGFFTSVSKLPGPVKDVGGGLALVAAAAGPLLLLTGALIRAFVATAAACTALGEASLGTRIQLAGLSVMENRLRFGAGIAGMAALTASTQTSNQAFKDLLQVGGAVATGFAVGGPVGAAIGGAAAAFPILLQHMHSASSEAKTSAANYSNLGGTLDDLTGAVTANTRKFIENQLATSGTLKDLATYGISTRTAISAVLGEGNARRVVTAAVKSQSAAIADQRRQIALLTAANVADEKAGTLTPKGQAARKQQIDQLKAQIAAEQNVADAVRKGIPAFAAQHRQALVNAAALADYSGKLKGLPKSVKVQFNAGNVLATKQSIAAVAKAADLTPRQIKVAVAATGATFTVAQIKKVENGLTDVNKVRPNLSTYKTVLSSQLDQAGGVARTGGTEIGNALGAGLRSAVAGWSGSIARTSADLVSNAISAARKAADAHSPSRKMAQLGQDMGAGLAEGIDKSRAKVLASTRDTIKSALDEVRSNMHQLSAGVRDAFRTDLFTDTTDIWGKTGSPISTLKTDIANAKAFRSVIGKLHREGLSGQALASVESSGNVQAARALASDKASVQQFEHLFNERQRVTAGLGRQAGEQVFGQKVTRQEQLLADIKAEIKKLPKDTGKAVGHSLDGKANKSARQVKRA